ncbi:hypothetical protein [Kitasatospora sp. NPDC058218]|uniref:hypothetical protein n=1 Tax=Kitasatospora sp. NPDC058218 TaxID=3346385 RepID=UPI0036DF9A8A
MPEPVRRGGPLAPASTLDAGTAAGTTGSAEPVGLADPARLADPTDPTKLDELAELAELDGQLIAQLLRRARCARAHQLGRRAAGLPASTLSHENAMLRQYTARLGQPGADIALAILALSRPPATPARESDRRQ